MKSVYVCVLTALALASSAMAGDFKSLYESAFDQFQNRGRDARNARTCVTTAGEALKVAGTAEQKYDASVLQSRCAYYVGMKTKGDDNKVKVFKEGMKYAEEGKKVLKDRAEAYFFYGINLGRWAEANGIMKSLGERHNLRRNMETVLVKPAKDDDGRNIAGKDYDGLGGNRTLGRMYFKLPGMFGGDSDKAEKLLREAVENTPSDYKNSLNVYYLAEVLVARDKKAEAKKMLDDLISYEDTPEKYNPRRVPETLDDIALAKALRKELGN